MGLGDCYSESANVILEGVRKYKSYSMAYMPETIEILTNIYFTLFDMDSIKPNTSKHSLKYCNKYAIKNWNKHYYGLFGANDYQCCETCLCDECVFRTTPFIGDDDDDLEGWKCECYRCRCID